MGRPSRYPEEFRREAVQLALSSDESRAAVARRLGVNETTSRNWVAAQLAEEARQADPLAVTASEFEELRRLRRCGRKRVARLMRVRGLVGVHARRRWRRGRPDVAPAPDLVGRNFNPQGPDRLWAADVT